MPEPLGYGVIYRDEDYAGFLRRTAILLIDLAIVIPLLGAGIWVDTSLYDNTDFWDEYYALYVSLFVAYLYLTTLKASKYGSLGQRITDTKIETIYGSRPSQLRMSMRLLYWILGPINFLTDLVFMLAVKERRSIRDCFCNTIVVRRNAEPIDTHAPVHVARIYALGLNLMYETCNSGYS